MEKRHVYILGGGTVQHIRPHLSLAAPAYGSTAKKLVEIVSITGHPYDVGLTKMAGPRWASECIGETNEEVENWIQENILGNKEPSIVFLNVAFCDFRASIDDGTFQSGKHLPRLKTSEGKKSIILEPTEKVLSKIRKERKDIFLVAWKTTAGSTREEMFEAGLKLLKKNSCNLVFVNDIHTRYNMIVTPELAEYAFSQDREASLKELVYMALNRSSAHFTRTTWNKGELKEIEESPKTLQEVLKSCIELGAYQAFNDVTVGHFGYRDPNSSNVLWSSRRKQNYNKAGGTDLCKVEFDLANNMQTVTTPIASMKASAGARSQFHVLQKFKELDCIIHFHCPLKPDYDKRIGIRPQRLFECGSTECGLNTVAGMSKIDNDFAVVMLDKHGPNICFSSKADPKKIVEFIKNNFDLTKRAK
jgi:hypothetical protein